MSKKVESCKVFERKDRPGVWTYDGRAIGKSRHAVSLASKDDAITAMTEAVNAFNNGLIITTVKLTSGAEAAAKFIDQQTGREEDGKISASHLAEVKRAIAFGLKIKIDGRPLAKHDIAPVMNQYNRDEVGRALMKGIEGEGKSKATAEKRLKFIKMFFNYAVTKGWGSVNPLDKLSLGLSSEISDRAPRIKTENVQKIIKDGLKGETSLVRTMVAVAICTGMRQGELRALPWDNVDFEQNCIRITQAVKHGNTAKVADPKTKRGFRTIPVPAEVMATLKELKIASKWSDDDHFVFASGRGTVHLKKVFPQIMSRICERAGVPLMKWGDFRHYYASMMISGLGEDWAEIAGLMGHSNTAFTYRQYAHYVKSEAKQDATRAIVASAMFG